MAAARETPARFPVFSDYSPCLALGGAPDQVACFPPMT